MNKQDSKQKAVSARDKCRFGSDVHSLISVKMHIKPTGGTKKHDKQSLHEAEKGIGVLEATSIMAMHPKWQHPNKALWASNVTTQP